MKTMTIRLLGAFVATAALAATPLAEARSGGVSGGVATTPSAGHGNWNGGGAGWNHGGSNHGGWNHGGWSHRGYWGPGPFWGGLGLGLGFGAYYSGPYYGGYYAYPYPGYVVGPGVAEYVVVNPSPGDQVVRTGQPVPAATRAPDPIFYPKNGQAPARIESDTQECNRWATTQAGAMSDASIFQRATFACMEGRGYTVR